MALQKALMAQQPLEQRTDSQSTHWAARSASAAASEQACPDSAALRQAAIQHSRKTDSETSAARRYRQSERSSVADLARGS
jgi:hypothetical protein